MQTIFLPRIKKKNQPEKVKRVSSSEETSKAPVTVTIDRDETGWQKVLEDARRKGKRNVYM